MLLKLCRNVLNTAQANSVSVYSTLCRTFIHCDSKQLGLWSSSYTMLYAVCAMTLDDCPTFLLDLVVWYISPSGISVMPLVVRREKRVDHIPGRLRCTRTDRSAYTRQIWLFLKMSENIYFCFRGTKISKTCRIYSPYQCKGTNSRASVACSDGGFYLRR